jgi:hypothetical protein
MPVGTPITFEVSRVCLNKLASSALTMNDGMRVVVVFALSFPFYRYTVYQQSVSRLCTSAEVLHRIEIFAAFCKNVTDPLSQVETSARVRNVDWNLFNGRHNFTFEHV